MLFNTPGIRPTVGWDLRAETNKNKKKDIRMLQHSTQWQVYLGLGLPTAICLTSFSIWLRKSSSSTLFIISSESLVYSEFKAWEREITYTYCIWIHMHMYKYNYNSYTYIWMYMQAVQMGLFKPNLCYGLWFLGSLEFLPLRERNASQQVTILRLRRRSLR